EALGGDQADPCPALLQDRVGRDGGAVEHLPDLAGIDPGGGTDCLDAPEHADGLVVRRRGGLLAEGLAGLLVDQQDVGEGSSDVDAEPVAHLCSFEQGSRLLRRPGPPGAHARSTLRVNLEGAPCSVNSLGYNPSRSWKSVPQGWLSGIQLDLR